MACNRAVKKRMNLQTYKRKIYPARQTLDGLDGPATLRGVKAWEIGGLLLLLPPMEKNPTTFSLYFCWKFFYCFLFSLLLVRLPWNCIVDRACRANSCPWNKTKPGGYCCCMSRPIYSVYDDCFNAPLSLLFVSIFYFIQLLDDALSR